MADISKVDSLDGLTTYNIKDATVRALLNGHSVAKDVPSDAVFTDTTYASKTEASGGTDVSLVTTGEKYTWNNKGTYSKPSGGIPKTDLASDIQTSLGKADTALQTHQDISGKMNASLKGVANGVAELDSSGKVPSSQLPSYVDDVLEYNNKASFPATGETGKIYVDKATNLTWRWSGTAYVEISPSLALGTTSSTAFRGDYGSSAYAHAVTNKGSAFSSGLYKITTNSEGHVTAATAVAKSDITGLGIPGSDTNTHRPIQVNGTEVLGNNTTALNLKAGSNVSVTNSSGVVTIAATDTTYSSKTAASGGTEVSLVTTGEKYTWNNKGTYSKPSGGIPDSDIASASIWNAKGTYSKPSGGIPKTDLASAVQTSLGLADSALQSHQTIKQDGVTGATVNRFGTCSTAADTAAKTVNITTGTFALEAGARVSIKFSNANTAGTPTLNVNSKGAKNIYHKGSKITTGSNISLLAGVVDFIYDGTQWHLIGNYIDTNSGGTITGITMNGASKGTSGVVDLGTVITAHQDISGKADKSATVSTVSYDSTNKKITKTINGTTTDVVTAATILGNLTKAQVTTALGYTPPTSDTNTHRPIQINGTQILGDNTTALNLKAGSNVSITNSSGTVTITATDTTYSSKNAASGGTDVSLVTTGEKYAWNNKASTAVATASANGLMSAADKISLNGLASFVGITLTTIKTIVVNE